MRVLIIGSLAGELGQAARIAIARGAKLDQARSGFLRYEGRLRKFFYHQITSLPLPRQQYLRRQ